MIALLAVASMSPVTIILAATALVAAGGLLALGGLLTSRESWKQRAEVLDADLADAKEAVAEQGVKIAELEKRADVTDLTAQVQQQHAAIMTGLEGIQQATAAGFLDLGRAVAANTVALQGLAMQVHADGPTPLRRRETS